VDTKASLVILWSCTRFLQALDLFIELELYCYQVFPFGFYMEQSRPLPGFYQGLANLSQWILPYGLCLVILLSWWFIVFFASYIEYPTNP